MVTLRISPVEIDVDGMIYTFASADDTDAFEACVAATDVVFCKSEHPPLGVKPADTNSQDMTP